MNFQDAKETFPNTLGPTTTLPLPSQIDIQSKEPTKEFARKKSFTGIFQIHPKNCYWPPPPIIFLQPQRTNKNPPGPLRMEQKP